MIALPLLGFALLFGLVGGIGWFRTSALEPRVGLPGPALERAKIRRGAMAALGCSGFCVAMALLALVTA